MRRLALGLAVVALLLAFLALRFPYDRVLPPLLAAARSATGANVVIGELGVGFGGGGPELVASAVSLAWPGSLPLAFDEVRLRPAWSPAWLTGRPLWHVAAEGESGAFSGVLGRDRLEGTWSEVDTERIPWTLLGALQPMHGRVSGSADLRASEGAWLGSARIVGREGSIDLPGLPVAIPYEALDAALDLGAEQITLASADLRGPMVSARASGTATAAGPELASWPLDLDVQIESIDPALRGYLGPLGIPVGRDGRASLRVTGSLAAPYLGGPAR